MNWNGKRAYRRLSRLLFLVVAMALTVGGTAAAATEFEELLPRLGAGFFSQRLDAIEAIGATGDMRAVPVLEALFDGDLFVRGDAGVVIARASGQGFSLTDPLTGETAGEATESELKKIRVNNRLRGAIRAALGALNLHNPNPAVRLAAAKEITKSRDPSLVPVLDRAISNESDATVRTGMELARAAILLEADGLEDAERIAAIELLGEQSGPVVRGMLTEFLAGSAKHSPETRAAAEQALALVESRLALWSAVGKAFQGVSLGSVLLLAAVGLAVTFGVMGVINMAHGELVMLGAYTTFVVQEAVRSAMPSAADFSVLLAVPAAFLVSGAFGIAIERGAIRHLYGRPLETLLATWGISLVLQQLVRSVFGPTNREVASPPWMSGAIDVVGGLVLTYNRIYIIIFALTVLAILGLVLRRTLLGLQIRAVTQNRRMAASMGIRTGRVDALTFGLGAGIAGIAGVALSQIDNVSPNLGQSYIVDSFMVVVLGGVGNLWGTLVGAMGLGIVNKLLEPWAGAVLAKILVLVAIILFIQKRPRGLFALKGRALEA